MISETRRELYEHRENTRFIKEKSLSEKEIVIANLSAELKTAEDRHTRLKLSFDQLEAALQEKDHELMIARSDLNRRRKDL